jgi:high-affinity Fe2+/Pb2+ permease
MNTTNDESADQPKPNWPLICGGAVAAIVAVGLVVGLISLYVANFNVLEWLE